jgi:hypothetical protein
MIGKLNRSPRESVSQFLVGGCTEGREFFTKGALNGLRELPEKHRVEFSGGFEHKRRGRSRKQPAGSASNHISSAREYVRIVPPRMGLEKAA